MNRSSSSELLIRRARESEAELVAELGARLFREAFGPDNDPADMQSYLTSAFSPQQARKNLTERGSAVLLASRGREVIGYAHLRGGVAPRCVSGPDPAELARIYVAQEAIGCGFGKALMHACLAEAKRLGYRTLWLGVWEKNLRARGFYGNWGFEEVGSQDFVLGNDVQEDLIMQRAVEPWG